MTLRGHTQPYPASPYPTPPVTLITFVPIIGLNVNIIYLRPPKKIRTIILPSFEISDNQINNI